jgi:uncharacterized protein (DUF1800 family)
MPFRLPFHFISIGVCLLLLTACGSSSNGSSEHKSSSSKNSSSSSSSYSSSSASGISLQPDTQPDPQLPVPEDSQWSSAVNAARFLAQASFGVTAKDIDYIIKQGEESWFEDQLQQPQSLQLKLLDQRIQSFGYSLDGGYAEPEYFNRKIMRSDIWWETAIWSQDQLRQRVAFALSQILVVSQQGANTYARERGFAHYHDLLARHAFGNYEDLLIEISTNPIMGVYLSFINNPKGNIELGIRPDENYAREILQLFSIGLDQLNLDGTPKLDINGNKIPTYNQHHIQEFARVFTGWSLANSQSFAEFGIYGFPPTNILPLKAFPDMHDSGEKTLLNGEIIAAGKSPEDDLRAAISNIMKHDNVGPFISKKLIQYLITSNPSPQYVARVASVFNDNGSGVKGDMKAVIKAIYFDTEARHMTTANENYFGKPREFPLQVSGLWRAFKAQGIQIKNNAGARINTIRYMNDALYEEQSAYSAPTVFNYYQSHFSPPGLLADNHLLAPEFQLLNQSSSVSQANILSKMIFNRHKNDPDLYTDTGQAWGTDAIWSNPPVKAVLNLDTEIEIANNPDALVARLNLLLTQGQISTEDSQRIANHISLIKDPVDRVYEAAFLLVISPEYAVQR